MTMTPIFLTGLLGSIILVLGAAWPEGSKKAHPIKSIKNWLLGIGGFVMLLYAWLGYQDGGSVFFVFLEALIAVATILMMANVPDKWDTPIILLCSAGLIVWSLTLFEDIGTVVFILGLTGIGLGYALETGSPKRSAALTLGSALVAAFSFLEASWIFFWLNVFFALFSGYYWWKSLKIKSN